MKINIKSIPSEIKGMVNHIVRLNGNCENMLKNYNKDPFNYKWYGNSVIITPLFCSYGCIGYSIEYKGYSINVDNEMNKIELENETI